MTGIGRKVLLRWDLRPGPCPADVSLPVLRSSFLRLDFTAVEVYLEHAEVWLDGPAFEDDKGAPLLNDFLPLAASLLWNPAFRPMCTSPSDSWARTSKPQGSRPTSRSRRRNRTWAVSYERSSSRFPMWERSCNLSQGKLNLRSESWSTTSFNKE